MSDKATMAQSGVYELQPLPDTRGDFTVRDGRASLDADPRVYATFDAASDAASGTANLLDVRVPAELRHRGLGRAFVHRLLKEAAPRRVFTLAPKVAEFMKGFAPEAVFGPPADPPRIGNGAARATAGA